MGGDEGVLPLGIPIGASTRQKKKKKFGMFVGIAALLLVGGAGSFFAYQHFFAEPPPPPPRVVAKPKAKAPTALPAPTPGPTPSETLNAIAAAPAKLISDAQNAIAGKRNGEQGRVDALAGAGAPQAPSAGAAEVRRAAVPATPPLGRVSTNMAVAPGVTTTTEIQASAEASAAFRSFVADARVSGVYQGLPPRAFINGRLIRVGQLVEESGLNIFFSGIDAENRMLLFKDRTGAVVSKHY